MVDERDEMDGSFRWSGECPDRYEITLKFSNGLVYPLQKYVKEILCSEVEHARTTIKDYIWQKSENARRLLEDMGRYNLDELVDVVVEDRNQVMDRTIQRFVDRSVKKYMKKKNTINTNESKKPPESEGHISVKNQVVEFLRGIGIEAYPEVVFYTGKVYADYYEWQRTERRKETSLDGIFGYGNVGFSKYKPEFGNQIKADVAGWLDESFKFKYPVIAVEVMKSSNLREEIVNLNEIHGVSCVFAVVVDALGKLHGAINNIPVVSLEEFKRGFVTRLNLVKESLTEGKSESEIFNIGKKNNARIVSTDP